MSNLFKKVAAGISSVAVAASMLVPSATLAAPMAGETYKTTDGTVWFISKDMKKHPFTSWGAYQSYAFLSGQALKDADASVTALPTGDFVKPRDGSIFCANETKGSDVKGECAFISGGKKAAFTSEAVFSGLGFSFSRAMYGDSSFLEKTSNIDSASAAHPAGTLINDNGTYKLVVSGGTWGIPSPAVLTSWGYSFSDAVMANSADKALSQTGVIPARVAGELVPSATAGGVSPVAGGCDLDGNAGSVTVDPNSEYSSEEVGEGEDEVPVMSFDVEADDSSDVALTSVKVELEMTGSGSKQLDDYASEVSVWYGDEMIGSADVDSFTETSNVYTKSISLDCVVIPAGETETFTVAVNANNTIDSGDLGEDWNVDVINVRYKDGDDVTSTDDTDADGLDQTFTFESFATSTDVQLDVSLNEDDSDINEAHIIDVDDSDTTKDVEILSFVLENKGDSDITVNDIPVNFDVAGGATNVDDMITKVALFQGDDQLDTASVGSGVGADKTYTFEDLDLDVPAGETVELIVKIDLKATSSALDEGNTISAQLSNTEVDAIDADDEQGDALAIADLTGTAVGEASAVYDNGVMFNYVSSSAAVTTQGDPAATVPTDDIGTFKITFTAQAFGDLDQRIDKPCEEGGANAAGQGIEYTKTTGTVVSCVVTSTSTDSEDTTATFELDRGATRTFTLTVAISGADDFSVVAFESINWGTSTAALTNANYYTFNLDEFKTDPLFLNNN